MWRRLLELAQTVLTLAKDVERYQKDLEEVKRNLHNLTLIVQRLSDEIKMNSQHEQGERERLALKLENEFLKFRLGLPSGEPPKQDAE